MKNIIVSVLLSVVLSTALFFLLIKTTQAKVGYIKSGLVLQEYKEMKEVSEQFGKEIKVVQSNLDTLRKRYESLKAMEPVIKPGERKDWGYRLDVAQNEYDKYNQQVSQQMAARKQELSRKVLETVNNFIQQYGKQHNYKLILGTTDDGSILYGDETDDLTKVVLDELNEQYSKRQPATAK